MRTPLPHYYNIITQLFSVHETLLTFACITRICIHWINFNNTSLKSIRLFNSTIGVRQSRLVSFRWKISRCTCEMVSITEMLFSRQFMHFPGPTFVEPTALLVSFDGAMMMMLMLLLPRRFCLLSEIVSSFCSARCKFHFRAAPDRPAAPIIASAPPRRAAPKIPCPTFENYTRFPPDIRCGSFLLLLIVHCYLGSLLCNEPTCSVLVQVHAACFRCNCWWFYCSCNWN